MLPASSDDPRLLADQRFLSRLARSLAGDEGAAEDAVQETFARAFAHGTRDRRPRAWLATVLRRVLAKRGAREAQREHVERRGAREELVELDPLEVEGRLALAAELADAVRRLREPFRSAIYLRYSRELGIAEIARQLEVPEATVKSRLRRGLEELRVELDRRWDGARETWLALALPPVVLAKTSTAVELIGGLLVKKLVLAIVVAAVGLVGLLRLAARPDLSASQAAVTETASSLPAGAEPKAVDPDLPAPAAAARALGEAGDEKAAEVAAAEPEPLAWPDVGTARVVGRLVTPEREPLAGVVLSLSGWPGTKERVEAFGRRGARVRAEQVTDEDGRFELTFDAVPAFRFSMRSTLDGWGAERWSLDAVEAGEQRDLGEVTMTPAARVHGRIVDLAGGVPAGAWQAWCHADASSANTNSSTVNAFVDVDPGTGRFEWNCAPPGEVKIRLSAPGAGAREGRVSFQATAGETIEPLFTYDGPDLRGRIALDFHRDGQRAYPTPEHVHLLDEDGTDLERLPELRGRWTYLFDSLQPGAYTALVDDPAFDPWRLGDLQPGGAAAKAELRGSASLALEFVDELGAPIAAPFSLIELQPVPSASNRNAVRRVPLHLRDEPLPGNVLDGLEPGAIRVALDVEGCLPIEFELPELSAGQSLHHRVALNRGTAISGSVRHVDGRPAAGVKVRLVAPALVGDSDESRILPANARTGSPERFRRELSVRTSDETGGFDFQSLTGGAYLIVAETRGGARAFSELTELELGARCADLVVELPTLATLRGLFRGAKGTDFSGTEVTLFPARPGSEPGVVNQLGLFNLRHVEVPVRSDGSFEAAGMVSGAWDLFLGTHDVIAGGQSFSRGRTRDFIERIELGAGEGPLREFDLGERGPRRIEVRLLSKGAPVANAVLTASPLASEGSAETRVRVGQADVAGRLHIGPLFPGEWGLAVESPRTAWWGAVDEAVVVGPDTPASLTIDLNLAEGCLQLVDAADGHALSVERVIVAVDGQAGLGHDRTRETDALGRLTLTHPAGHVRLARLRGRGARSPEVTATLVRVPWPPAPGEIPVVRLP